MTAMQERYAKALRAVAEREPGIYSPARVAANLKASEKMTDRELLYFVLAMEGKNSRAAERAAVAETN